MCVFTGSSEGRVNQDVETEDVLQTKLNSESDTQMHHRWVSERNACGNYESLKCSGVFQVPQVFQVLQVQLRASQVSQHVETWDTTPVMYVFFVTAAPPSCIAHRSIRIFASSERSADLLTLLK